MSKRAKSTQSATAILIADLTKTISSYPPNSGFLLAYSGGLDSHVLLHALRKIQSADTSLSLRAIHINHQLQADANVWEQHCVDICADLSVDLTHCRVQVADKGISPEAAARETRYAAFEEALQTDEILMCAHHRDDQAETFLLRLFRGSGIKGLAAMRSQRAFGSGWLARPLLKLTRAQLEAYAQENDLCCIEDPSNRELRFDRNFVRHEILPRLTQTWPAVSATLVRNAGLQAEAGELIDALAESDLAQVAVAEQQRLNLPALKTLTRARQKNLLRYWFAKNSLAGPAQVHIEKILDEVVSAREDASPILRWDRVVVRRYREELYAEHDDALPLPTEKLLWDTSKPFALPGIGCLELADFRAQGLQLPAAAKVEVGFGGSGLRLKLGGQQHHKPLKKLFQEAGIPPWQRTRSAVLYINGEVAAVAGLGVVDKFYADERTDPINRAT